MRRVRAWVSWMTAAMAALGPAGCGPRTAPVSQSGPLPANPDRLIRVRLAGAADRAEISIAGAYRLEGPDGQRLLDSAAPLDRTILLAADEGVWLGERLIEAPRVHIVPAADSTLSLSIPDAQGRFVRRRYRGVLWIVRSGRALCLINALDIESYVAGVLQGELYAWFDAEVYRALAVAARTYALFAKATAGTGRDWDLNADASSQVYLGVEGETPKVLEVVRQTTGVVLTWDTGGGRRIFCPFYHSTCGGATQDVAHFRGENSLVVADPLRGGVTCDYCCRSPDYRWDQPVTVSKQEITRRLQGRYARFADIGPITRVQILKTTPDGRATQIYCSDARRRGVSLRAEDFRLSIGASRLRSTAFKVRDLGDAVEFYDGRGNGHGVGLCQWGAEGLARQGWSASQILRFYYPGCHFDKAYD